MDTPGSRPPLRIAILVTLFPNIVQTYVLNHILCLRDAGAQIRIVAEKNPDQTEVHPDVRQNDLLSETVYVSGEPRDFLKELIRIPFTNRRYLRVVRRILFSNIWKRHGFKYGIKALLRAKALSVSDFDLLHSHSLYNTYCYLFVREIFSVPIVTTFHGLEPANAKPLAPDKVRAVLNAGDAFFVNTRFAGKQLADLQCPSHKVHIIPQGTNTQDFPFRPRSVPENGRIIVLSVGRLSMEKGFHIGVRAIAHLKERFPHIEYWIIGSGPEEEHLSELIRRFQLQGSVTLHGSANKDKLLSVYSAAHIFILPSVIETQGVVLQEAQSSGIPVIASTTGGIPEVIQDGETGLLFDEGNDKHLADQIEVLLTDKKLYKLLSLQARDDVEERFSLPIISNRLLCLYDNILRKELSGDYM